MVSDEYQKLSTVDASDYLVRIFNPVPKSAERTQSENTSWEKAKQATIEREKK